MTLHIGELSTEVVATGGQEEPPDRATTTVWEERCRTAGVLDRLARDRMRTATGDGRD